jgi:cobalt transporter subunit CbtB
MPVETATLATTPSATRQSVRLPALLTVALGLVLLFGTGMASPMVLHNAAHDARHAFAFPCH